MADTSPWEKMNAQTQGGGANTQVTPDQQAAIAARLKGFKGLGG